MATTDGHASVTIDIPVEDGHTLILPTEALRQSLGQRDRAVAATRAAHGDGQVRLSLAHEGREDAREQFVELLEERSGLGLPQHPFPHRIVEAAVGAELLDPERVRQEAAVEHDVDVEWDAVLVPE